MLPSNVVIRQYKVYEESKLKAAQIKPCLKTMKNKIKIKHVDE